MNDRQAGRKGCDQLGTPTHVARAAHLLAAGRRWDLPVRACEVLAPRGTRLSPALQDMLADGALRPDTALRLAAFEAAEFIRRE
ncbi:hypothetical protein ACWGB8_20980 [Kitasatospora sp. NPDC054939]